MGEAKYTNFDQETDEKVSILTEIVFDIKWSMKKIRAIALAVCLLVAIIVCVVMAAILVSKNENPTKNIYEPFCVSSPCLKSAAYVTKNMNKTVDPCENFYKYACDAFPKYNPLKRWTERHALRDKIRDENDDKITAIISAPIKRGEKWSFERKFKHFFESCTNTYQRDIVKGKPVFTKIISQIGGWSVTRTLATSWNFKDAMKKAFVNFWIRPFYTIRVVPDRHNKYSNILEIRPTTLSMHWWWYMSYHHSYYSGRVQTNLRSYMKTLGSYLLRDSDVTMDNETKTARLNDFVNDAYNVEMMLADVARNTMWSYSWDSHREEKKETIRDLDDNTNNTMYFDDTLTAMFAEAGITKYTKVAVTNKNYLLRTASLIQNLGANRTRVLNNYLVWRILQKHSKQLSSDYIHASKNFRTDLYGYAYFSSTEKSCARTMEETFRDAVGSLFVRDHFADKNKEKVEEIVRYLKNALASTTLDHIFDAETRDLAKEKLQATIDKLGYPDFMMDDSHMDVKYSALEVDKDDYFANALSMYNFKRVKWNTLYKSRVDKSKWPISVFSTRSYFSNNQNELFIPAGLLQFPFYDYTLLHSINFGSMGSLVGQYLVSGVSDNGAYFDKDGTYKYWWSNFTHAKYTESLQCVEDYLSSKTLGPYKHYWIGHIFIQVNGKRFAPQTFAETSGVRVAYKAYREWVKQNREEKMILGPNVTSDQTFFLSFAQSTCSTTRNRNFYYYNIRGKPRDATRTNSILAQLPEFVEAFKCSENSPMNAKNKCNFF